MSSGVSAGGRPRAFGEEAVLGRAAEVLWRYGYEGSTLSALTGAMGIIDIALRALPLRDWAT
jgi:hypothetical protein